MLVLTEKNGPITTVIINRPEAKNAVDGPTAAAVADAFREFEADDEARVAVLCGSGNTFCAGADLKAIADHDANRVNRIDREGDAPLGPSRMMLSKPSIAAVAGYAVAGGLELALWCDLRVMEQSAVMGVFCRRFGVPLIDGGTIRLPRMIGMSRAQDLILTGRPVESDEALSMGLVNRVVPDGTARKEAEALALQIAEFPQICMNSDRASAYEQWDLSFEDALMNEFKRGEAVLKSGESVSGAKNFEAGKGRHGGFADK